MIAFWEECIQNAFSAFWEEYIQNAFSAKTKNQDFPKFPEQILVRTKPKNQEPRFPQDSWANLGSNQNQEPRFPQDSWANLGFGSNQDLLRSPGGILVLGSWFWI